MIELSQDKEKKLNIILIMFSTVYLVYKFPENLRIASDALKGLELSAEITVGEINPIYYIAPFMPSLFSALPLII
jgi:predicted transcriptional regulator